MAHKTWCWNTSDSDCTSSASQVKHFLCCSYVLSMDSGQILPPLPAVSWVQMAGSWRRIEALAASLFCDWLRWA